jgi:hypothetical protein
MFKFYESFSVFGHLTGASRLPELSSLSESFPFLKFFSSVHALLYTQPVYICVLHYT